MSGHSFAPCSGARRAAPRGKRRAPSAAEPGSWCAAGAAAVIGSMTTTPPPPPPPAAWRAPRATRAASCRVRSAAELESGEWYVLCSVLHRGVRTGLGGVLFVMCTVIKLNQM
jgi:hypothetical protein